MHETGHAEDRSEKMTLRWKAMKEIEVIWLYGSEKGVNSVCVCVLVVYSEKCIKSAQVKLNDH